MTDTNPHPCFFTIIMSSHLREVGGGGGGGEGGGTDFGANPLGVGVGLGVALSCREPVVGFSPHFHGYIIVA